MNKAVIFILILLLTIPLVTAIDSGVIDVNEIYKRDGEGEYYVYDDLKGEEVGVKAIFEGALGILPSYTIETETFSWPLIENMFGFGKVAIKALLDLTIDLVKLLGSAIIDLIKSLF